MTAVFWNVSHIWLWPMSVKHASHKYVVCIHWNAVLIVLPVGYLGKPWKPCFLLEVLSCPIYLQILLLWSVCCLFRLAQMQVLWVWRRSTLDWRWLSAYRSLLWWPRSTCARQTSCRKRCRCCTRFSSHRDVARCPYLFRRSTTWSFRQWTSLLNGRTKLCGCRSAEMQLHTRFGTVFHGEFFWRFINSNFIVWF